MTQIVLYMEEIVHEICSDLLLSSLQNISVFPYSNNVFFYGNI